MRFLVWLAVVFSLALAVSSEQQRILRRVIKSTPTANQLTRVRAVTVRSSGAESGGVTEISSKEAANFGQRSANETGAPTAAALSTNQQAQQQTSSALKTKTSSATNPSTTSTTSAPSTTPSTPTTTTTTTTFKPNVEAKKNKASDRRQAGVEVELLSSAPSSWQTMTAVEAPAAMLIATGTRAASSNDLASSGSTLYSSEESASQTGDFLRSSGTKGGSSHTQQSVNEAFSRLRQQSTKTQQQQQQQAYFYPQENRAAGKTSQGTKTHWYQTTTTPRPAPIIQEQQYEQQNEQYVEQQQQQVDYGAAPLGQAEPFAFDFNTKDNSGNGQYRKEESDKNGVVRGSYGYTDANGIYRHVEYFADASGFHANIKSNEPGLIGETQPASIQMSGGAAPAPRLSSPSSRVSAAISSNENNDWIDNQGSSRSADLALAPPEFESSHKSERLPRHYRN